MSEFNGQGGYTKTDRLNVTESLVVNSAPVVRSSIEGITGATAVTNVVKISQEDYDAIGSPDSTTLYIIV